MSKEEQQQHITSIGGQAVMEGVMMRGPFKTAVAVRKPDGDIECKVEENGTKTRKKFWRLPIIRGCVSFVDSLVIGMKALMFSAEFVDIEEEEGTESKFDKWLDDKFGDKIKDIVLKYTPSSVKHIWNVFCDVMVKAVGGYLKACFKIMFIMFVILWCFFGALHIKHAMVIAVITALLDFLPFIGTGTVIMPWAAYYLLTGGYVHAAVLIVAYFVTMIVRRLIEPKLVGDSIGISPFLTLLSMFIGYRWIGMLGLIIGIPAGMIIKALFEQGVFESQIRGIKILAKDINEFRKY